MRVIARTVLLMFILTILLSFATCVGVLAAGEAVESPGSGSGTTTTPGTTGPLSPGLVKETPGVDSPATIGIKNLTAVTLKYLQMLGSITAVIILAVFGVQWFLASSQQKAQLKEKMWAYAIGATLVFGGPFIFGWIASAFYDIFNKV